MKPRIVLLATLSGLVVSGCGSKEGTNGTEGDNQQSSAMSSAATAEPTEVEPAEVSRIAESSPSLSKGKIAFLKCRSCHTTQQGEPHSAGPNLAGMFGKVAGAKEGYAYSTALQNSNVIWDRETLDAYIKSPQGYIPGNKMAFAGVADDEERAALISFLEVESQ